MFIVFRLKLNLSKCEVAGIGILEGVKVAVSGIKCIDSTKGGLTWNDLYDTICMTLIWF